MRKYKHYLTGIPALNHHYYDWHQGSVDYSRHYPDEVKTWCDWGIEDNIANPIRAYLDYLFYNIKFERRVPNMRIDMFLFDDQEEQEILEKIETLLKPALLDDEELKLLALYKDYLKGGKYDFRSKSYTESNAYRKRVRSYLEEGSYFNGSFFQRDNDEFIKTNFENSENDHINSLAMMKLSAIESRTTASDLYDIASIVNKHSESLDPKVTKAIYDRFKNVDFRRLLIYFESAFEADENLSEIDLLESTKWLVDWLSNHKVI